MKKKYQKIFFLFLIIVVVFLLISCKSEKREIKKTISNDLNLLKNLDKSTTDKYLSYQELFPEATQDKELTNEAEETFSLFFQNFDYKILDIVIDHKNDIAYVSVRLETPDSRSIAEDFISAHLKNEIFNISKSKEKNLSLKSRYVLLNQLLSDNEYEIVESNCEIVLTKNKENKWEISPTYSLENDLVGGLITYLADPDILSPEKTLSVYLSCLKEMTETDIRTFLGIDSLMSDSEEYKKEIANALTEQIHKIFDYKIISTDTNMYMSTIQAEITTFDSESILEKYQSQLDDYLATADAVIDGSEKRYEKATEILLECIINNKDTITSIADFHLINNGNSWTFKNGNSELGTAIFGNLTTSPVTPE